MERCLLICSIVRSAMLSTRSKSSSSSSFNLPVQSPSCVILSLFGHLLIQTQVSFVVFESIYTSPCFRSGTWFFFLFWSCLVAHPKCVLDGQSWWCCFPSPLLAHLFPFPPVLYRGQNWCSPWLFSCLSPSHSPCFYQQQQQPPPELAANFAWRKDNSIHSNFFFCYSYFV